MTSKSVKIRSLILTALMVFSVFAGTVALTGSAAAAGNTSGAADVRKATHYVDASGNAVLEVSFDEDVELESDTRIFITQDDGSQYEIYDGGFQNNTAQIDQGNDGQLKINTDTTDSVSDPTIFNRVDNITIENVDDVGDDEDTSGTFDVRYASSTVDLSDDSDETDGAAGDTVSAYRGANVSLVYGTNVSITSGEEDFTITGQDNNVDRTRASGRNSEVYAFDTDTLDLGDYDITNDAGANITLSVEDLGLTAEADESSFDDNEDVTATVSAEDIDRDVEARLLDASGDEVATEDVTIDSDGEVEANFGQQDADENYTVEVEDLDTGVTATSDAFDVVDVGDEEANFDTSSYQEARGDIVNISIQFDNTDTATLQVGDQEDDNYYATAEVEDDDDDGIAYVEFNSFYAGSGNSNQVLTSETDDVGTVVEGGDFDGNNLGEDVLAASDYDILVRSGERDGDSTIDGDEDSVATLTLDERSTDSLNAWIAPEGDYDTLAGTDADGIAAFIEEGNLTQSGTIAEGDTVVLQITANGLEGTFDTTSEYTNLISNDRFINLTVEEETAAANADPAISTLGNVDSSNISVIYGDTEGAGADNHYVVLNSENITELDAFSHEDGDDYLFNFTTWDSNAVNSSDLSDENVSVDDTASIEDPEVDVDTNSEDFVVLEAADGQEITGDTNFAPGTELTFNVRSDGAPVPFLEQPEPVVQSDGTFTATVNFSAENEGGNFTVQPRLGSENIGSSYDGYLVEATGEPATEEPTDDGTATEEPTAPPTDDGTATEEPTEEETTMMGEMTDEEEETTMGDGTEAEETTTGSGGPGFTAAIALIALVAAALLAVRRDN